MDLNLQDGSETVTWACGAMGTSRSGCDLMVRRTLAQCGHLQCCDVLEAREKA